MSQGDQYTFTPARYLRERLPMAGVWLLCVVVVFGVALVLGVTPWGATLLCLLVTMSCCVALSWDYLRKRDYYDGLAEVIRQLESVRHLSAFVDEPHFLEGRLSWEACETLAYLAGRELNQAELAADAYERYIETWIHEVKTPIAASRLILGRLRGPEATALRQELESIERYVEQALYYARIQSLSSDYTIRELSLAEVVREACKRNQNLLIASGVSLQIDVPPEHHVFSDKSWLIFMLGQLLSNAAKYGAKTVRITSRTQGEGTSGSILLEVADDGEGIPENDMPRIFDQGFVGENGRAEGSATGMGLFLCARLCEAMGMGIEAFSEVGRGTRIVLTLSHNRERLDLTQV